MEVLLKKGKQRRDNLLEIKVYQFSYQNIVIKALPLTYLFLFNFYTHKKKK